MDEPSSNSNRSIVLACRCRPPSTNNTSGKGRDKFGAELEHEYEAARRPKLEGLLYGVVCWFVRGYRVGTDPDADNISKNVWDMLSAPKTGDAPGRRRLGAFKDDKQVRLRVASIFDLEPGEADAPTFQELDLSGMSPDIVQQLGDIVSGNTESQHLTYIQCSSLHAGVYKLPPLEGAP